jgi:hypothetical protein
LSRFEILVRLKKRTELKTNETKIDLSDLENGVYLLKKGDQVVKVIKK